MMVTIRGRMLLCCHYYLVTNQKQKHCRQQNIEQKHDSPVHELKLEFQNGELKFWKNYQET